MVVKHPLNYPSKLACLMATLYRGGDKIYYGLERLDAETFAI
jgi:hypothetical protein